MKKFQFPLEKLRAWRKKQLEAEEARLESLFRSLADCQRRNRELAEWEQQETAAVIRAGTLGAKELEALENFRSHLVSLLNALNEEARGIVAGIEKQRQAVIEAQRKVELLENLKQEKLSAWRAELNREEEAMVAELVVARWNKKPG